MFVAVEALFRGSFVQRLARVACVVQRRGDLLSDGGLTDRAFHDQSCAVAKPQIVLACVAVLAERCQVLWRVGPASRLLLDMVDLQPAFLGCGAAESATEAVALEDQHPCLLTHCAAAWLLRHTE